MFSRRLIGLIVFIVSGIYACDGEDRAAQGGGEGAATGKAGPPSSAEPPLKSAPPPAKRAVPMAFAAGQWTKYRRAGGGGGGAEFTLKIVGVERTEPASTDETVEEAVWLEVETPSAEGTRVFKILVSNLADRTRKDLVGVRGAMVREGDEARTLVGPDFLRAQAGYVRWAHLLVADWGALSREDVTVPAGTFTGACRGRQEEIFGPFATTGAVWSHPTVPVTGMVKFRGDGGLEIELVEFGTEGATSVFPEEAHRRR